jgi:hypothetical protein
MSQLYLYERQSVKNERLCLTLEKDEDFRKDLHSLWAHCVGSGTKVKEVELCLDNAEHWVSADTLNIILTFVEALQQELPGIHIHVCFLELEKVYSVLGHEGRQLSEIEFSKLRARARFFLFFRFAELLHLNKVDLSPSFPLFMEFCGKLKLNLKRIYPYSSNMLPLSPLIDSLEENSRLTERINNATHRVPSKKYLDWMQFIHKFVI